MSLITGTCPKRDTHMPRRFKEFIKNPFSTPKATAMAAGERARVLEQDAAVFTALVSSTTSLRLALFSTPGVISPCGQLDAWHLLVHMPTPTLDQGSQRARGAGACVAGEWASVRSRGCATGQRFLASLAANWDGIKAV